MAQRKQIRWHIAVFLAPAVLVYTAIMIVPLFGTLNLSLFNLDQGNRVFVGMRNFATLFGDPRWSEAFWNALGNNTWFFVVHMLVQNPIGVMLAALLFAWLLGGGLLLLLAGVPARISWRRRRRAISKTQDSPKKRCGLARDGASSFDRP